jgi:tetratricopeptide (TPR) repeat protein
MISQMRTFGQTGYELHFAEQSNYNYLRRKSMKKTSIVFALFLLAATMFAQQTSLSIHVVPGFDIPIFEFVEQYFPGASSRLNGELAFTRQPSLFATAGIDYNFVPYRADNSLSLISAEAGVGLYYEFLPRFGIKVHISGGGHYAFINQSDISESGAATSFSGGVKLDFMLTPGMSIGIGATYKNYLGLYNGVSVQIGPSFFLTGLEARRESIESRREAGPKVPGMDEGVKLRELAFAQVYPVFHKYYDSNAIGTARLENIDSKTITDIKLMLLIEQYMDAPKKSKVPESLESGESAQIELYALLKDTVMEITEGAKVPAELTLEYKIGDDWYKETLVHTITMYHRNAVTWDDNRKASAFVTAKDPVLLDVSKNIAGIARSRGIKEINNNLSIAIALHEAISLYGVNYVVDPSTPYEKYSEVKDLVDYLQFPRSTLRYKAGDCDDLSILYCAMLESVGIDTAFITVPGHIYMAFSTGMKVGELRGGLLEFDEIIIRDDMVWIPVEITVRDEGFLKAWQAGMDEWLRFEPGGAAGFYPMSEAWELYQPVGVKEPMDNLVFPDDDSVLSAYMDQATKFLDTHIKPLIDSIKGAIETGGKTARNMNKLGTLYARYGKLQDAEEVFLEAAELGEYAPVSINLGNLYFIQSRPEDALIYLNSAREIIPDNARLVLTLARVHYELADYAKVDELFAFVKDREPALAAQFSYLDMTGGEGTRASNFRDMQGVALWQE